MYTVMVVDDSPFIVDIFVTMLERGGYKTLAAYGGEEALETLRTVKPDLILLDIMMEPMDGWETLMHLKNGPETKEIPVMMLTAKQLTPSEAQEYGIYIEDYIMKPITHRELYDAIENLLSRKRMIETDMKMAAEAGVDRKLIDEYSRLRRQADVSKRLLRLLENTYKINDEKLKVSDDINLAIKSMAMNIRFQEERLEQLRKEFSLRFEEKKKT
ncbi:CheY-like chemotaxis protein [Methanolinea mesophila]|uniref:response regulator n=1 Tax=Methanolinea mesophila TaxID=547055 RepID=UPI001AE2BFE2|nr:response regulator [Methanolinea mesophila]MBP1928266.1 CheY-like chemotaxis protein [Methanolinea mesophila]